MITWEVYYPKIQHNSRIETMFDFALKFLAFRCILLAEQVFYKDQQELLVGSAVPHGFVLSHPQKRGVHNRVC